jgi:hypothetical protein
MPELRVDIPADELQILDGYCMATGKSRLDLVRDLIKKFTDDQLHVAMMVCRVARINPLESERDRNTTPGGGR